MVYLGTKGVNKITYLFLAIYSHNEYKERLTIKSVRELRTKIRNEAAMMEKADSVAEDATYEEGGGFLCKGLSRGWEYMRNSLISSITGF